MSRAFRSGAPLSNDGPTTPHRAVSLDPINDIIYSLENRWKLGLQTRDSSWSPSRNSKSTADKIYDHIKYWHYKDKRSLNRRLDEFSRLAHRYPHDERPGELLKLLPYKDQTVQSSARDARLESWRAISAPSLRSQLCKCTHIHTVSVIGATLRSRFYLHV